MLTKYESKLAGLNEDHARRMNELEAERAIWEALPESLAQLNPFIHIGRLYGSAGSIDFRFCEFESLRKGISDPTLKTVRDLAIAFPEHSQLSLYRSGSVGVREVASISGADHEHATITPIAPYLVRLNRLSNRFEVEWRPRIADRIMRVSVAFREHSEITRLFGRSRIEYEYANTRTQEMIIGVRINQFTLADKVCVIGDARGEQIRYSSGDSKRPGDILVYWDSHNGEHANSTVLDLIDAVK